MNKQEMVQQLSNNLEVSKLESTRIIEALEAVIEHGLVTDKEVVFMGSKFKLVPVEAKPEKQGRNPKTGESMTIPSKPATTKVVFKVGKKLKERFI